MFLFSSCLQISRVYQAGTGGEKNIPSSMGEIGKRERDGWGEALELAISVLASVTRILSLRGVRCIYIIGSYYTAA